LEEKEIEKKAEEIRKNKPKWLEAIVGEIEKEVRSISIPFWV